MLADIEHRGIRLISSTPRVIALMGVFVLLALFAVIVLMGALVLLVVFAMTSTAAQIALVLTIVVVGVLFSTAILNGDRLAATPDLARARTMAAGNGDHRLARGTRRHGHRGGQRRAPSWLAVVAPPGP